MNFRTTYILFGAVAVVLVAFLLLLAFGPGGDADEYVLKSVRESVGKNDAKQKAAIESITRLEIERLSPPGETLVFVRAGNTWKLEKPYDAKIDGKVIDDVVTRLVEARVDRKADITHKLAALGLDAPSAVITLRRGEKDKDVWLKLGNVTPGGSAVVFALASDRGRNDPIAIRKGDLDGLFREAAKDAPTAGEALKTVTDFRPHSLLAGGNPMAWDAVNRIRLKEGTKEIVLQKELDGNWRFVKPEDYGPADPEGDPSPLGPAAENIAGVKPLLTLLTGLRIGDAADVVENPPKFDEFGLDEGKESLRVELGMKTGETDVLRFGKTAGGKVAARLNNESFVVKFPDKAVAPVRKLLDRPMVMRDRNLLQLTPAGIDAVDIMIHGEKKFELRLSGMPKVWRLYEEGGGDVFELANSFAVQTLLNKLTERRTIKDFPDSKPGDKEYGLDPPAVEVALWQNGVLPEKPEEKKDGDKKDETEKKDAKPAAVKRPSLSGEPTVRLKFGKREKDLVNVRRYLGTFSTLLALPESLAVAVSKPEVEYLDLLVPSFDPTKVVKLLLQRGADNREVEKDKGDPASPTWKILAPADLAGRTPNAATIKRAVDALSHLQPAKIVAARATDAELERFGLKAPKTVAAVTVKDVKEPFTYSFGNETEDKKFYYARFAGKDRVYHVAKDVVDGLLAGDLQDTTIFRLDPARVKAVKFAGWKDVALDAVTLEFARKSEKEWEVKGKADYAVDNEKFAAFLAGLDLVRAERFVKGPPTPEMGLDVKAGALALEITVEGEATPITVTLGALEKDKKTYYATSNRAPGAVFLLFKDRFEKVREKPTYFKKM
jgi:hypothetical protein